MRARAFIFDLDGTLADSLGDIADAMNAALKDRGLPVHSHQAFKGFVGEGVEEMAARASPKGTPIDALVVEYRAHYARANHASTAPYDGIPHVLDVLQATGKPLCVLSNKRDDFTVALVEKIFARWRFALVRGERKNTPRKPDPTSALDIARALDIPPADFVFVGDTAVDMGTARAAGMVGVGCLWGFRERAELEAAGARHVIASPLELLALDI